MIARRSVAIAVDCRPCVGTLRDHRLGTSTRGDRHVMSWRAYWVTMLALLLVLPPRQPAAFPVGGEQAVLPAGAELNEHALGPPREVFRSEAQGGRKSYLVNLGDLAFNSPVILGGVAREAGMSCATCHVNGASNARLYIPGMSTRPGNFDRRAYYSTPKPTTASPIRCAYRACEGHAISLLMGTTDGSRLFANSSITLS